MKHLIGSHDIAFITIDTLRYDVAAELAARAGTPYLATVLPGGRWERRHSPSSFTYAAHHAFCSASFTIKGHLIPVISKCSDLMQS